jgi:hypothetical protein
MNFYSASVALLWKTVFGAVAPSAGSRRGVSSGGYGGCKMPTTPERNRKSCQTRSKREGLP